MERPQLETIIPQKSEMVSFSWWPETLRENLWGAARVRSKLSMDTSRNDGRSGDGDSRCTGSKYDGHDDTENQSS